MRRDLRTLPLFADSFLAGGFANCLRRFLLRRLLNRPEVRWVANHSIAASLDLARIGVDPRKVLPFDWPPVVSPASYEPKTSPTSKTFRLLYVGLLVRDKGVGDAIRALQKLPSCTLTVVGAGAHEAELRALPASLGVQDRVVFRGKIPHEQVLAEMRDHDAVLVTSWHEYAEGLPMTIYEALCTRTPVVASDHPMFLKRIVPDRNALIFRSKDPGALAQAIERLRNGPELYKALSVAAGESAETYLLPLKWHLLLDLWLQGDAAADARLSSFSIANRSYA
jgi:glycosyltransferase involved in cell wall biosynthesis